MSGYALSSHSAAQRPSAEDEIAMVDSEFISWVHKTAKIHKKHALPEVVEYCSNHYRPPAPPKYQSTTVARRTLSPIRKHQLLYAGDVTRNNTHKVQFRRGTGSPLYQMHSETESNTDGKHLFINQLSDGFTIKELHRLKEIGQKKVVVSVSDDQESADIRNLLKSMRSKTRLDSKANTAATKRLIAMRQTNTALQQGNRNMRELLYETEHRLLSIQAGGSYLSHFAACQKRSEVSNILKNPYLRDPHYRHMQPRPAVSSTDRLLSSLKMKRADMSHVSEAHSLSLTLRDVAISTEFNMARTSSKRKQTYYEKLMCIHIILCTMMNMKQPKVGPQYISWQHMKSLRAHRSPQQSTVNIERKIVPSTTSSKQSAVSGRSKASTRTDGSVGTFMTSRSTRLPPIRMASSGRQSMETDVASRIRMSKQSPYKTTESTTLMSRNSSRRKLPRIVPQRPSSSIRRGFLSSIKTSTRFLQPLGKPKTQGSTRNVLKSLEKLKRSKNLSAYSSTAVDIEMFNPATITWDEFVKWGNKDPPGNKKMRFASGLK